MGPECLPTEMWFNTLSFLSPPDVVHFGQACRFTCSLISPSHQQLWQAVFLNVFDDPRERWDRGLLTIRRRNKKEKANWDWYVRLRQRCEAVRMVSGKRDGDDLVGNISPQECVETILNMIDTARCRPSKREEATGVKHKTDDARGSRNLLKLPSVMDGNNMARLERLIQDSHEKSQSDDNRLQDHGSGRPATRSMTQKASSRSVEQCRLHVLRGLTGKNNIDARAVASARRLVYDWSLSDETNDYGPFKQDGCGKVDWRRLEAALVVIVRLCMHAVDHRLSIPQDFCSSIPYRVLKDRTNPGDWACGSGAWIGTYCFIDYADLSTFNTWADAATRPSLQQVTEMHGDAMRLELKTDESLKDDPALQTKLPMCKDLPPLYFSGTSRSWHGPDAHRIIVQLKAMACLCPGGREVRWKYIVSYQNADQWQLEGVQPGGIRSGMVYGIWTQVNHEDGGPVGAFCYAPEPLCYIPTAWNPMWGYEKPSIESFFYRDAEDVSSDEEGVGPYHF